MCTVKVTKSIIISIAIYSIVLLTALNLNAQSGSVSSGGDAAGSTGTISYSVGQTIYAFISGNDVAIVQGIQQPYEIQIVGGEDEAVSVYPNPVTIESVTLKIESIKIDKYNYQLFDFQGRLILEKNVTENKTIIPMGNLATSAYIIKVLNSKSVVKTFKIVKNQ